MSHIIKDALHEIHEAWSALSTRAKIFYGAAFLGITGLGLGGVAIGSGQLIAETQDMPGGSVKAQCSPIPEDTVLTITSKGGEPSEAIITTGSFPVTVGLSSRSEGVDVVTVFGLSRDAQGVLQACLVDFSNNSRGIPGLEGSLR